MEDFAELLLTLASADRLTLFCSIARERFRLTQLASKLSASTQETSRHLSRLQEVRLIEKQSDGRFTLTSFGKTVEAILPSLRFLTEHSDYFLSHDISALPIEFIQRIGELQHGEFAHGIGVVLSHTAHVLRDAKSYVWLASDNVMDLGTIGAEAASGDLHLNIIVPVGSIAGAPPLTAKLAAIVEVRLFEKVCAGLALNEKTAGVALPDLSGKIDFNSGFASSDPSFHKWCSDLFIFQWSKAKKI